MEIIYAELTDREMMAMKPPVPLPIQMRSLLEKRGIKFTDTGKIVSAINENPVPVGELTMWECLETGTRKFKQIIDA